MSMPKNIGIIGLGAMGRPMARHLLGKDFAVAGCDPHEPARDRAAMLGVTIAANARDLARQSDAVLIVVGFDAQVEQVIFGVDGVLAGARPGLIVAMGSTIAPAYERVKESGL
jgi:3-hydroxyisobutyrate dehydrogenase-like beta-hydroxyacid dehydrogenase